jgi:uncharacterized protein with NRDE domain
MCLAVLALHLHPRWPLVIAANRDEFHDRATAPLDWWAGSSPRILAGRDLEAGGTWMGVADHGRLALLTNVRDPQRQRNDAPSRGALVTDWLGSQREVQDAAADYAGRGCNPFNLLMAEGGGSRWWWMGDGHNSPRALAPGFYGLSNAQLDTPWPKVERLKAAMSQILSQTQDAGSLADELLAALADRNLPPDDALPLTGVPLEVERLLAPAFISGADLSRPYGTRSSSVVVVELGKSTAELRAVERSFDAQGRPTLDRCLSVPGWTFNRNAVS